MTQAEMIYTISKLPTSSKKYSEAMKMIREKAPRHSMENWIETNLSEELKGNTKKEMIIAFIRLTNNKAIINQIQEDEKFWDAEIYSLTIAKSEDKMYESQKFLAGKREITIYKFLDTKQELYMKYDGDIMELLSSHSENKKLKK